MNTFEDDAINDDFEVEISDLDPENETRPISSAIVSAKLAEGVSMLRSRISFKAYGEDAEEVSSNEDFELEITDLPANDEESRIPVAIAALPSRLPRKVHMLRLATVGIAILLMLGVVLEGVPSARDAVLSLLPRPTPTPTPASATREFRRFESSYSGIIIVGGDISISSTPIAGATVVPWNPDTPVSNVLNPAPEACPFANVPQDPDSADFPYGNRVGGPPLWVIGFQGAPAQLTGFTRANPPQYGWVRQVTLMLEGNADGPVMLQGAHLLDGTPLLFSDPDSGQSPTTFLTLNLDTSSISNQDANVQWGVQSVSLYIPAAGCYYLEASWAGGSWEILFAAGK